MTRRLPPIERLEAVELAPGDLLVVTVPANVPPDHILRLRSELHQMIPGGAHVVVCVSPCTMEVIRPTGENP